VGSGDARSGVIEEESSFRFGDDEALRVLYEEHGALIYSYCHRVVGPNLAADVTQEVFISAWRSRESFDPEKGTFAGWLMAIAKRRCIDALRRTGRRPEFATDTDNVAGGELGSTEVAAIERIADRMLLDDVISQLPARARRAVELAFFEQLTHPEIAATTGTPLGTVKSDIRRALATMRRQLGGGYD
jgi:RNA polymerase sigma-70 factor (ECF subfamily)